MDTVVLIAVLFVVSAVVFAIVGTSSTRAAGAAADAQRLIRAAGAAGVAAVASTLLYLLYAATPALTTLFIGDVAMVTAPALIWFALPAPRAVRTARAAVSVALLLTVWMTSATAPVATSVLVKTIALVVITAGVAIAVRRREMRGRPGATTLFATFAGYALYSLVRVVLGIVAVTGAAPISSDLSTNLTSLAGVAAVIGTGIGCVRFARTNPSSRVARPAARLAGDATATAWTVRVAAPGSPDEPPLGGAELLGAVRDLDAAATPHRSGHVVFRSTLPPDAVRDILVQRLALAAHIPRSDVASRLTIEAGPEPGAAGGSAPE